MLNELGIAHSKESLLEGYGVESSKDLTEADFIHILNRLEEMKKQKKDVSQDVRKLRSEILTMLTDMGIYKNNGDWQKVNSFLLDPRIAGKLMYEMTLEELKELKPRLYAIKDKWTTVQNKEKLLTQLN